ncbi:hypothetical protein HDK90DRAFT_206522 [Phyllosticta capitalensis]|uniref:Secreted protein n=1 Tax=Phyllosticta capitalensis TaxID=121624 RepID=A0ABR1YSM0_9PEZI
MDFSPTMFRTAAVWARIFLICLHLLSTTWASRRAVLSPIHRKHLEPSQYLARHVPYDFLPISFPPREQKPSAFACLAACGSMSNRLLAYVPNLAGPNHTLPSFPNTQDTHTHTDATAAMTFFESSLILFFGRLSSSGGPNQRRKR